MESEASNSISPSGIESSSVLEGEGSSSTTTSISDATWRMEGEEIMPGLEPPYQASLPICHNQRNTHKKSFIDDLTLLEKIYLSPKRKNNWTSELPR